ncbi:MAG: MFS transporter [Fuerstiella sp.]
MNSSPQQAKESHGWKPDEWHLLLCSAAWFATLLAGYYMIRPVREAMGVEGGIKELKSLFAIVFGTMLVAVPCYAQLVSRLRRRLLVPIVYRFLISNLLLFSIGLYAFDGTARTWVARTLFVWVSVYSLFAMSLFWSVMADTFRPEQGKRLFGSIAGAGTMGGLLGSAFAGSSLISDIGVSGLLLFPAVMMEFGLFLYRRLEKLRMGADLKLQRPTGGNPFSGFTSVLRSPYLLSICGYVFLTAVCGTTLYLQQAEVVGAAVPNEEDRVQLFARLDFYVQALTLFFQFVVAGWLMKFSLPVTLCVLPLAYLIGFSSIGMNPTFYVTLTTVVFTRAAVYGLTVPAQGVLYTVVSKEEKYKAKNVIDTVVTRGGDAMVSQIGGRLNAMKVPPLSLAWWMIPIATAWLAMAYLLGLRSVKKAAQQSASMAEATDSAP